jgi:hypothetical protein
LPRFSARAEKTLFIISPTEHGVHPNHIIPNTPDPVNGQQRWMDTVVKMAKA